MTSPKMWNIHCLRILGLAGILFLPASLTAGGGTINVEIDYMVDGTDHSHRPNQDEIDAVVQMFACQGWTLNVVIDDAITHYDVLKRDPNNANNFFGYSGSADSYGQLKAANFDRGSGWHYCIFGHQYQDKQYNTTGSSGLGEINGDDFIVTMGSFTGEIGVPWDRASTFAHELGHNLGLRHGGGQSGVGNYKPNYASIMSYRYQLRGVRTQLECNGLVGSAHLFKDLDFSHGRLPPLDESALDEEIGIGMHPVDWNCSGGITTAGTIAHDLDDSRNWCTNTGNTNTLTDYNDWANISSSARRGPIENAELSEECISAEEYELFMTALRHTPNPNACPGPKPDPVEEFCRGGQMIWVDDSAGGFLENGTGFFPYNTLLEGYNAAPNNSVIYLMPGSYSTGGMLLDKDVTFDGPGAAFINQ